MVNFEDTIDKDSNDQNYVEIMKSTTSSPFNIVKTEARKAAD